AEYFSDSPFPRWYYSSCSYSCLRSAGLFGALLIASLSRKICCVRSTTQRRRRKFLLTSVSDTPVTRRTCWRHATRWSLSSREVTTGSLQTVLTTRFASWSLRNANRHGAR